MNNDKKRNSRLEALLVGIAIGIAATVFVVVLELLITTSGAPVVLP